MTAEQLKLQNDFIEQAQRLWKMLLDAEVPSARQFAIWYKLHEDNLIRIPRAITEASRKEEKMQKETKEFSLDHAIRFASATMNVYKNQEQEQDMKNTQTETELLKTETETPKYRWGLKGFGRIGVPEAKPEIATDSKTGALVPQEEK